MGSLPRLPGTCAPNLGLLLPAATHSLASPGSPSPPPLLTLSSRPTPRPAPPRPRLPPSILHPAPCTTHRPVRRQEGPAHAAVEHDNIFVLAGVDHPLLQRLRAERGSRAKRSAACNVYWRRGNVCVTGAHAPPACSPTPPRPAPPPAAAAGSWPAGPAEGGAAPGSSSQPASPSQRCPSRSTRWRGAQSARWAGCRAARASPPRPRPAGRQAAAQAHRHEAPPALVPPTSLQPRFCHRARWRPARQRVACTSRQPPLRPAWEETATIGAAAPPPARLAAACPPRARHRLRHSAMQRSTACPPPG